MKKEYIKPIIEYCHSESDIIAASVDPNIIKVDDSGADLKNDLGSQNYGDKVPTESKENFWNLWEDDDMEFEF